MRREEWSPRTYCARSRCACCPRCRADTLLPQPRPAAIRAKQWEREYIDRCKRAYRQQMQVRRDWELKGTRLFACLVTKPYCRLFRCIHVPSGPLKQLLLLTRPAAPAESAAVASMQPSNSQGPSSQPPQSMHSQPFQLSVMGSHPLPTSSTNGSATISSGWGGSSTPTPTTVASVHASEYQAEREEVEGSNRRRKEEDAVVAPAAEAAAMVGQEEKEGGGKEEKEKQENVRRSSSWRSLTTQETIFSTPSRCWTSSLVPQAQPISRMGTGRRKVARGSARIEKKRRVNRTEGGLKKGHLFTG